MTPDVAVVISLNRVLAPLDDTVTAHSKTQVTSNTSLAVSRVFKVIGTLYCVLIARTQGVFNEKTWLKTNAAAGRMQ